MGYGAIQFWILLYVRGACRRQRLRLKLRYAAGFTTSSVQVLDWQFWI